MEDGADLQPVIDPVSGIVSYKYKRPQRKINNYNTWLEAYMGYEKVMVQAHGIYAYFAMSDYKSFIMECDRKFHWPSVYALDIRHRQSLSGRSINFNNVDPTMLATMLDSSTVKNQPRCTKCRGPPHPPGECTGVSQAPPRGPSRNRSASRGKPSNEICNNFNTNGCTYEGCRRAHKCLGCKGDMPYKVCHIKGPCASQQGKDTQ